MNLDNDLDVIALIKMSVSNGTLIPLLSVLMAASSTGDAAKCERLAIRFEGYYRVLLAE